jgi:hypothetical protein
MLSVKEKRDRQYLRRLREADEALYQLWKKCEVNSTIMSALNSFQCNYIHEEIRKVESRILKEKGKCKCESIVVEAGDATWSDTDTTKCPVHGAASAQTN